jgi:hypothetical protein
MQLDWVTALKRGRELLRAGRAEDAIALFNRSIKANPGEYGTTSGIDDARQGIKDAKALMKKRKG